LQEKARAHKIPSTPTILVYERDVFKLRHIAEAKMFAPIPKTIKNALVMKFTCDGRKPL